MDGIRRSERPPVYHVGREAANGPEDGADDIFASALDPVEEVAMDAGLVAELFPGVRPRLFVLVRRPDEDDEDDGEDNGQPGGPVDGDPADPPGRESATATADRGPARRADDGASDETAAASAAPPPPEVIAFGVALPRGSATTLGTNGGPFGQWRSPESAAHRLRSELVWVSA
ncbi:hypothetical protein [Actinomadura atramentaria]|uniref:hypothetical protein n=1 Tax=Actinomadura atramentaria TaxID=1990 RepID=UPI000374759B|nr:hypothetical protein [Actinomadura atramentaria]